MNSAIAAFWQFWAGVRADVANDIATGSLQEWVGPISDAVKAVDQRLEWEMGAGQNVAHYLCVSSNANPEVRVIAERWKAAAPADDETFEYHAARPGSSFHPDASLDFGDVAFVLGEFSVGFEVDDTRERLNVVVHHPTFATCPEQLQETAAFISLDSVLGEDGVERWLGHIQFSTAPLDDEPVNLGGLLAAVDALAESATGEQYVMLRGETPDGDVALATVNHAVKRINHLLLDMHLEIEIPILQPTEEGMPGQEEGLMLNEAEDQLLELLGHNAVFIAHETVAGSRIIHLHAAAMGPAIPRIREWVGSLPSYEVEVRSRMDPEWDVLDRY